MKYHLAKLNFPIYFSFKDRLGVILSGLFSLFALLLLIFLPLRHVDRLSNRIAFIQKFHNNVKYKEINSLTFYNVRNNESLQNYDEISTGVDSSADIKFFRSETFIKTRSSSLIRIEQDNYKEKIEIKKGSIDITAKKDQEVEITIDGQTEIIKGINFGESVRATLENNKIQLQTLIKVDVNSKTPKDKIDKMQKAKLVVNKEKEKEKIAQPILKKVLNPPDQKLTEKNKIQSKEIFKAIEPSNHLKFVLVYPQFGDEINQNTGFKIKINKKSNYIVSLSKNIDFNPVIISSKFDSAEFNWKTQLPSGDYYLKVQDNTDIVTVLISLKGSN